MEMSITGHLHVNNLIYKKTMKKKLFKLSNLLFLILLSLLSYGQPNWFYTNTGTNHTVLIQGTAPITINGVNISIGDYIGVFYDSLGTLACAGYNEFTGGTSALTVWGDDASTVDKDGFSANETFSWKIWRASDGAEFNAVATYSTGFPNQGAYVSNGMSSLGSLTAVVGSDLAVGNISSPVSGCGTLTNAETFSFQVLNIGTVDVDSFTVSYSIDGGASYFSETIVQLLTANSAYVYTSGQTFDFSALGTYQLAVAVFHPNDNENGNDTLSFSITNSQAPIIDLSGINSSLCESSDAVLLSGLPAGGVFTSNDVAIINNNSAYFTAGGNYQVYYTFTDSTGCSAMDSIEFSVLGIPDIDLGADVIGCEGDMVVASVASGFTSYTWNTGATDSLITITNSGTYYVTVTNANACMNTDSLNVDLYPLPVVDIQGDTVNCTGVSINLSVAGSGNSYLWNTGSYNDNIDVTDAGDYSVTVSANGCIASDSVSVSFFPLPDVDLGDDFSICDGTSADIDAGVFAAYEWSNGSTTQVISVDANANYSVTVTDDNGCSGSDNLTVTVDPLANADFSFTINNYTVSFTNESQNENAGTYIWNFGDGETSTDENPEHTYTADDSYSVMLVVGNDCGNDTISMTVTILDIEDLSGDNNISVFPNPSNGTFIVELQNISSNDINISVVNTLGQEVFSSNSITFENETRYELNLTNKPAGFYFLTVKNESWVYKKLIVIE